MEEAFVVGNMEAAIRALVNPVEPQAHVALLGVCGRALQTHERQPCDRVTDGAPAGKDLKHAMTSCAGAPGSPKRQITFLHSSLVPRARLTSPTLRSFCPTAPGSSATSRAVSWARAATLRIPYSVHRQVD